MSPIEVIRIAWEGLVANKIRSLLTMLGVIIGVAAVQVLVKRLCGSPPARLPKSC